MSQYELQRLNPAHFQIVDLCLQGYGPKEISQVVGMTPQAVSLITKSPVFQQELSRRRETMEKTVNSEIASTISNARLKLEANAEKAIDKVTDLMEKAEDERVQLTAARDILDRVFGDASAPKPQIMILDAEALENLKRTFQEVTGKMIDVISTPSSEEGNFPSSSNN